MLLISEDIFFLCFDGALKKIAQNEQHTNDKEKKTNLNNIKHVSKGGFHIIKYAKHKKKHI